MEMADFMENDQARVVYVVEMYKNDKRAGKVVNSIVFARIQDTLWSLPDGRAEIKILAHSMDSGVYKTAVHNSRKSETIPSTLTRLSDRLSQFILTPPDI